METSEGKMHPLLAWSVGLVVGFVAFIAAGVVVLFPIAYSAAHGAFSSDAATTLVPLVASVTVFGACSCLAYRVIRALTLSGSGAVGVTKARTACGVVVALALLLGLTFALLNEPAQNAAPDVFPTAD